MLHMSLKISHSIREWCLTCGEELEIEEIILCFHQCAKKEKIMTPAEYLKRPYSWCLVWDTESKTWTGRILEFPGCIAQADSADILLMDLKQAAHDWIAAALDLGQEIPEPVERVWPK